MLKLNKNDAIAAFCCTILSILAIRTGFSSAEKCSNRIRKWKSLVTQAINGYVTGSPASPMRPPCSTKCRIFVVLVQVCPIGKVENKFTINIHLHHLEREQNQMRKNGRKDQQSGKVWSNRESMRTTRDNSRLMLGIWKSIVCNRFIGGAVTR